MSDRRPASFLARARLARARRVTREGGRSVAGARGFSLIIAMLMLAVIGLASAAIMRNATSGDQVANNNRLQTQAHQYAQLALRFCEAQMAQAPGDRAVTLLPSASTPAWTVHGNWTKAGAGGAHTLTPAEIGGTVLPRVAPQCMVEATALASVYTVTARGFSADYQADKSSGATRSGSTVWLQGTVYAEGDGGVAAGEGSSGAAAATGPLAIKQRLWQQLLTPPF